MHCQQVRNSSMNSHIHCRCSCGHQHIANNNQECFSYMEDTPTIRQNSKKNNLKKRKNNSANMFSLFSFLRLSLAKSSISGVNSIAASKSIIARILWTLMLVSCCVGFGYQTFNFLRLFQSRPSIVLIDIDNEGKAQFPAVTICNKNRIRKTIYCKYNPAKCENLTDRLIVHKKEIFKIMYSAFASNFTDLQEEYGHNKSIVQSCAFTGIPPLSETECLNNVRKFYDPDYGNCYVIPAKTKSGEILYGYDADFWQEENELSLLLDIQRDEFIEEKRDPGLILTVHPDNAFPDIHTDGHDLVSGKSFSIGVLKTTMLYLPLPYKTNCTDFNLLPWNTYKRQMTSRICTVGCSQYYQFRKCGFVTTALSLFYETLPWNPSTITEDQIQCATEEETATTSLCRSQCGVPCERKHDPWNGVNATRDNENLMHIRVFYKTLENRIFRHTPQYDTMELFSYLGGYSGVWLGFSLLTVYELLEIIFATFKFFLFKRKNRIHQRKLVRPFMETKKTSKPTNISKKNSRFLSK